MSRSSLNTWRRWLFLGSRALGDAQAVKRGRIGQRVVNRTVGRQVNKAMKGIWR